MVRTKDRLSPSEIDFSLNTIRSAGSITLSEIHYALGVLANLAGTSVCYEANDTVLRAAPSAGSRDEIYSAKK